MADSSTRQVWVCVSVDEHAAATAEHSVSTDQHWTDSVSPPAAAAAAAAAAASVGRRSDGDGAVMTHPPPPSASWRPPPLPLGAVFAPRLHLGQSGCTVLS